MITNFAVRLNHIHILIESHIATEEDCYGQLVNNVSFRDIIADILQLTELVDTAHWREACRRWITIVDDARTAFNAENGFPADADYKLGQLTIETQRDFARRLKFALTYGALYVAAACRE